MTDKATPTENSQRAPIHTRNSQMTAKPKKQERKALLGGNPDNDPIVSPATREGI
jgi:hypothetical protein